VCEVEQTQTLGVQQARENLRGRIDAALEQGEHTIITRVGRPVAVIVPYQWYCMRLPSSDDDPLI
jgi:prevent-host-death family protein